MFRDKMKLTFCGGAGTVSGANFLIQQGDMQLLVDCGMYQGGTQETNNNARPWEYDPASIDVLIVTHAHSDHIGRIPKLVKDGFRGVIFSTQATRDLSHPMLLDSASLLSQHAHSDHTLPLYQKHDVEKSFTLWRTLPYGQATPIGPFTVTLLNAGHILGSALVSLRSPETKIHLVMTGDLGNSPSPLLPDTDPLPADTTHLVTESVYGDRAHDDREHRREQLLDAVLTTIQNQGTLLIPVFSLERTQELLIELSQLRSRNEFPSVPIFVDSPLGSKITAVFEHHISLFRNDVSALLSQQGNSFLFHGVREALSQEESRALNTAPSPKIILASSGMSSGGRIPHHLLHVLPSKENMVLFVGYQGKGTLGRTLQDGASSVRIFGKNIPVRSTLRTIKGYSGHKDGNGIISWIKEGSSHLREVYVVMGDSSASHFLAKRIREELNHTAITPEQGQEVTLDT